MTSKMKLYIGLLVLGVALIGGGVWFLVNAPTKLDIPEGSPIILEERSLLLGGEASRLYIYEDGRIIYIEEKNLRQSVASHPPTRIWKTGNIQQEELKSLIDLFKDSHFRELNDDYQTRGKPNDGGFLRGDMRFTISIVYEDLSKKVTTFGYLSLDHYVTLPDMPYPLNEIYKRLRVLAMATEEVYQENISP